MGCETGHVNSCIETMQLTSSQFEIVMENSSVKTVLLDLDVNVFDPVGLFDTFDGNGDGVVNLSEFVFALMKLRGEPQKNDMIATWTAIRTLQEKMDHVQSLLLDNQEAMKANQMKLLKAM